MPTTLNDINLGFLDASDAIIEIVTYDSTTIHNTIAMADTFQSIGYPASKVRYLVNRADSPGGIDPADLARALGPRPGAPRRVATAASWSSRTTRACRSSWPIPTAPISQDIVRMAATLTILRRARCAALAPARR